MNSAIQMAARLAGMMAVMSMGGWATVMLQEQGAATSGGAIGGSQVMAVGWTQAGAYAGVTITAALGRISPAGQFSTVTAYLLDNLGPTATAGDVLHQSTVQVEGNPVQGVYTMKTLFSGLSLGAGTYYMVLTADDGKAGWELTNSPNMATGPGVTSLGVFSANGPNLNPNFSPASIFTGFPNVGGTLIVTGEGGLAAPAVPEPGTLVLIGAGLVVLGRWRRDRIAGC